MDKEILAIIGQLYVENIALRNMLEAANQTIASKESISDKKNSTQKL